MTGTADWGPCEHITRATELDLGETTNRLDAVRDDPAATPEQIAAAEAAAAEARVVFDFAVAQASEVRQADLEAGS